MSKVPSVQRAQRPSGVHMVFTEHTVIKYQSIEKAHLEYLKTIRGEEIGRAKNLFRVPSILEFDARSGAITFERLRGLRSLAEALSTSKNPERLIAMVGRALAAIHNEQPIAFEKANISCYGNIKYDQKIFIHGDFSVMNIYFGDGEDDLVILDWSMAAWIGREGIEGRPCYLDLSILILSLFFHRPFEAYRIRKPCTQARVLLQNYYSEFQKEFSLDSFKRYFNSLISVFIFAPRTWRAKIRVFACYPSVQSAKKCVRNLKEENYLM